MQAILSAVDINADPWRYQFHPEVWALILCLTAAYLYTVNVIGPQALGPGVQVVSRRQKGYFIAAMLMLYLASDWPLHDIGEQYLYMAHMLQHMMLAYFLPPLAILAFPEWLLRLLIGQGRGYRVLRFISKPVIAGVAFNLVVMITHVPGLVNASADNGILHYSLHFTLVMSALMMWLPVIGPFKELHMGYAGKMIYLFLQSVVPTVPAGWLTFAESVVYKHYDIPVRVWGVDVRNDQQIAGAIMKIGGSVFLWTIVIYMFFKRFTAGFDAEQSYRRERRKPDDQQSIWHPDQQLTYEHVTEEFGRTVAAPEPERSK
jgi:putative membrane protein